LIAFLPKYANDPTATQGEREDRLPLWLIRDESNRLVDPSGESVGSSAQPSGHTSRGGSSSYYSTLSDMKHLPSIPKVPYDPETGGDLLRPIISDHPVLKPARNPPPITIYDYIPVLSLIRWIIRKVLRQAYLGEKKKKKRPKKGEVGVGSHIPLELSLVLSNYSAWLMKTGLVQAAIATGLTTNLASLQDTVLNLERISTTPLPFAYQVHLRMSLWLYLAFLPFQIYLAYGVVAIPATAFASFLLLGFLEIGQQIENPFDYDENDLDLDFFCFLIQRDLHQITANVHSDPSTFIFTKRNQPFVPADLRSAEQLTRSADEPYHPVDGDGEPGINSLRRMLVRGWKTVDNLTRSDKGLMKK